TRPDVFPSGPCHHQHMSVGPFVGVRLPDGNEPADLFSFQKLDVWRDFLDCARINTDVCNDQLTDIAQTGIDNLTELWVGQGNRHLRMKGDPQRRTVIYLEYRSSI